MLDVLNGVRSLGKQEFSNGDAYTLAEQLEQLHPDNRHVRDKIRQQLPPSLAPARQVRSFRLHLISARQAATPNC